VVQDWEARTPYGAFVAARDGLMVGPAAEFAADTRAELRRRPADVVMTDLFLLGSQVAAAAQGVPTAVLAPNLWGMPGWGVPPLGPGFAPARGPLGRGRDRAVGALMHRLFDTALPRLNAVRAGHGLPPATSVLGQLASADLTLVMTSPGFEYPGYAPPPSVRVVGPRLDDPAWAATGWTPPRGDSPLVLVGLSSTNQQQGPLLQRIATALGMLDVQGPDHDGRQRRALVDRRAGQRAASCAPRRTARSCATRRRSSPTPGTAR
jgi:UDP:flavonoid glycosyltransferase YjiC (YdhE family)